MKNLLGVVSGIAHQTVRTSASLTDFAGSFTGRLAALARAHEVLTAATWESASLHRLVALLIGSYAEGQEPAVAIAGADVLLPPKHLLSLSMVLHELLTNAVKYGALSHDRGRIAVVWAERDGELAFDWIESGMTGVSPPQRRGFGTRMIDLSVGHELRGRASTDWHPHGLAFRLTFPIPADHEALR